MTQETAKMAAKMADMTWKAIPTLTVSTGNDSTDASMHKEE
jgi:hypothetical protein